MKITAPDYYPLFRCIAGACRHSCCIGWEIDIDDAARERYRCVEGPFGERLAAGIEDGEEYASFRLDAEERCPFLNRDGLCDIILTLGEDALAQICRDHPRFRSFFSDRTEIGLGLCCEAAAELILSRAERVRMITLEDDGTADELTSWETEILARRAELITLAQDRSMPSRVRLDAILKAAGGVLPQYSFSRWTEILLSLEQMDPAWEHCLRRAAAAEETEAELPPHAAEQLAVYFLTRHLPDAKDADDFAARAAFAVLSVTLILALCARLPGESPAQVCRLYSAEIEYSEENTAALIEYCRGL